MTVEQQQLASSVILKILDFPYFTIILFQTYVVLNYRLGLRELLFSRLLQLVVGPTAPFVKESLYMSLLNLKNCSGRTIEMDNLLIVSVRITSGVCTLDTGLKLATSDYRWCLGAISYDVR